MSRRRKLKLGDIAEINKLTYSSKDNWKYANYLDTGNITNNNIEKIQHINFAIDRLPERAKRKVNVGDIIYSLVAPKNRHYGMIDFVYSNYLVSTGFAVISVNSPEIEREYLYFFLTQNHIVDQLQSLAEQNTSVYPSIKTSDLSNIELDLPPVDEQKSICKILLFFEDKIAVNRRINKNLEQQIQAIFKSWFVDFEPFRQGDFIDSEFGKIPVGWQVCCIGELPIVIVDYIANGGFANLKKNVKILEKPDYAFFIRNIDLKSGEFKKYVDEYSYHYLLKTKLLGGEVLISNIGDVGSVFLCPHLAKPMTLGNNMIMLKDEKNIGYNYFLYILFKFSYGSELIRSITSGSVQSKFNKTDFRSLRIIKPDSNALNRFNNIVVNLFNQKINLDNETKHLNKLRATLMPKLISGEIDLPKMKPSNLDNENSMK